MNQVRFESHKGVEQNVVINVSDMTELTTLLIGWDFITAALSALFYCIFAIIFVLDVYYSTNR